jgi:hypothetical protein
MKQIIKEVVVEDDGTSCYPSSPKPNASADADAHARIASLTLAPPQHPPPPSFSPTHSHQHVRRVPTDIQGGHAQAALRRARGVRLLRHLPSWAPHHPLRSQEAMGGSLYQVHHLCIDLLSFPPLYLFTPPHLTSSRRPHIPHPSVLFFWC